MKPQLAILLPLLLLLNVCSTEPPQIREVFTQFNFFRDTASGRTYQKLSLFVIPFDPDGEADLAGLYLIKDDAQLFWTVEKNTWQSMYWNDNNWVGTNSLTMYDLSNFPAGEYRLVLEDLGGETGERTLELYNQNIDPAAVPFPALYRKDKTTLEITNAVSYPVLWIYDSSNQLVSEWRMDKTTVSQQDLNRLAGEESAEDLEFYVYTFWQKKGVGIIVGPYRFVDIK